ncbi:MAG: helix-turn-helix domain-containing protein [Roseimicrobium sp.]
MVIGERLKLARQQRGWTLEALSTHTQIPVSSLSEFENGRREPRLSHIEKLAQAHGLSAAWFFESEAAESAVVLWRERPESPDAVATIEGHFLKLCGWYKNLETWCNDHRPCMLPEVSSDRSEFDWADVECLALNVRNHLNLGQRPAFSLLNVLENTCGVRVFHFEFEPSGTAACTRSDEIGMAILLNVSSKRWRRNFDLAHELFHLLTWKVFRDGNAAREASELEEKYANAFASNLLVPEEPLRAAVAAATKSGGGLKHAEIFEIARQFDVSTEALLWRMHRVFNRKQEQTENDIQVCKAFRDVFEIREDANPPLLPERFRALAVRALRNGELSVGRAAEYLGVSRHEAMKLDNVEDVTDDAISLSPA